jgi:hypothetical protein
MIDKTIDKLKHTQLNEKHIFYLACPALKPCIYIVCLPLLYTGISTPVTCAHVIFQWRMAPLHVSLSI